MFPTTRSPEFEDGKTLALMPKIFTFELHQDDPKKCTSAKMRKFGFARKISRERFPRDSIVLNPSSDEIVLNSDRESILQNGLVVIDCSWNRAEKVFGYRFKGRQRTLPALLAGNPTNYSKLGSLSSVEAVSACLYITGFKEDAEKVLSLYKWGKTFLDLNGEALEDYSKAKSREEIRNLELAYFPNLARTR